MSLLVPVLRARDTARFSRIAPGGFRILAAFDGATKILGRDLELTSGTDSHSSGRHPLGEAYDLSVEGLTIAEIEKLKDYLARTLGPRFTVLYEVPTRPSDPMEADLAYVNSRATGKHLHAQVKKSTVYPPLSRSGGTVHV